MGLLEFAWMSPTALQADSRNSCQLCLVTHTDKHVGDQKTSRQSFQVISMKLVSTGLPEYRVLSPIKSLTHFNPLFLIPSYNACALPYTSWLLKSPWCCTGNLHSAAMGRERVCKAMASYSTAHC